MPDPPLALGLGLGLGLGDVPGVGVGAGVEPESGCTCWSPALAPEFPPKSVLRAWLSVGSNATCLPKATRTRCSCGSCVHSMPEHRPVARTGAPAHRHRQQVAVEYLRLPLLEEVDLRRDEGSELKVCLHLPRSGDRRVGRDDQQTELSVVIPSLPCGRACIRVDREIAHQDVPRVARSVRLRDEAREHRVRRSILLRHLHRQVVRRLQLGGILGVVGVCHALSRWKNDCASSTW